MIDIMERIEAAKSAESLLDEFDEIGRSISVPYDAVLYNLVVIGEAIRALPDDVKSIRPDIPWSSITGLRNILTHEYFAVNIELIHTSLDRPLAQLFDACGEMLQSLNDVP